MKTAKILNLVRHMEYSSEWDLSIQERGLSDENVLQYAVWIVQPRVDAREKLPAVRCYECNIDNLCVWFARKANKHNVNAGCSLRYVTCILLLSHFQTMVVTTVGHMFAELRFIPSNGFASQCVQNCSFFRILLSLDRTAEASGAVSSSLLLAATNLPSCSKRCSNHSLLSSIPGDCWHKASCFAYMDTPGKGTSCSQVRNASVNGHLVAEQSDFFGTRPTQEKPSVFV